MKKFARHRSLDELRNLCVERGVALNTDRYDCEGSDYVVVSGLFGRRRLVVIYSVVNGRFFGKRGDQRFSESSPCDGQPWFDAILDLVYAPVTEAAHG